MNKVITYRMDEEREMIYFSNGKQSLITSCGHFLWNNNFYHEDMVKISKETGLIFKKNEKK